MAKKIPDIIGRTYRMKVGGRIVSVKILKDLGRSDRTTFGGSGRSIRNVHRGWEGFNLSTGRKVHISSMRKLRGEVPPELPNQAISINSKEFSETDFAKKNEASWNNIPDRPVTGEEEDEEPERFDGMA